MPKNKKAKCDVLALQQHPPQTHQQATTHSHTQTLSVGRNSSSTLRGRHTRAIHSQCTIHSKQGARTRGTQEQGAHNHDCSHPPNACYSFARYSLYVRIMLHTSHASCTAYCQHTTLHNTAASSRQHTLLMLTRIPPTTEVFHQLPAPLIHDHPPLLLVVLLVVLLLVVLLLVVL